MRVDVGLQLARRPPYRSQTPRTSKIWSRTLVIAGYFSLRKTLESNWVCVPFLLAAPNLRAQRQLQTIQAHLNRIIDVAQVYGSSLSIAQMYQRWCIMRAVHRALQDSPNLSDSFRL